MKKILKTLSLAILLMPLLVISSSASDQGWFFFNGADIATVYSKPYSKSDDQPYGINSHCTFAEFAMGSGTVHGSLKCVELLGGPVALFVPYLYIDIYQETGTERRFDGGGSSYSSNTGYITYYGGSGWHNTTVLEQHAFLFAGSSVLSVFNLITDSLNPAPQYINYGVEYFWNRIPFTILTGSLRLGGVTYLPRTIKADVLNTYQSAGQTSFYIGLSVGILADWSGL
ncbi:MAG: hypothetical protein A2X41_08865 [Candidatus Margulisbacteria bacterium GWE2_39_32]|nr:MAG: hypothetical protein A2X41_08865 [Candidatus Margulisbacteria bacterium GWE2_39_32]